MTQSVLPAPPQSVSDDDGSCPLLTFALVDCAHLDGLFYQETVKDPDIMARSLLVGTPHEASAIAGPLLIQVTPPDNTRLAQTLLSIEAENPALVWLWSTVTFAELHPRLQTLLFGERKGGQKIFLRYFDPRLLAGLLTLFKTNWEARKALSAIQGWAVWQNDQYRYLN
jgi:hypothetical protein